MKPAGMVQIINLFPSVSVVIEQPIPSIQGGWNRGYFFSLLELCWALALTLPGAMVLGSFGNPVPAIHCKEPFRDNNFEFRCVTWASKDLFMLMKYPEKRWVLAHSHSAFKCSSKTTQNFQVWKSIWRCYKVTWCVCDLLWIQVLPRDISVFL